MKILVLGFLQMAWPSSLPFEVKLADICGWRGWMAGWVIEVRWEPVFQPLGPMSWLPPPPPPPNPSFHPFLQILHQSSEDLAATASQLNILATKKNKSIQEYLHHNFWSITSYIIHRVHLDLFTRVPTISKQPVFRWSYRTSFSTDGFYTKKIISEQLRFLPLIWFCSIPWTL